MRQSGGSERYSRQILHGAIGREGQERISGSSVAIIGCGALGSVSAALLARAGVGRVRIVDRDFVDTTNLQRQMLFDEDDVREMRPKAVAAARTLSRANSEIAVDGVVADVNPDTIVDLVKDVSLVIDGTDNFETRFLINDVSIRHGIPWIYAACLSSYGLTMNILPGETACLRCVMDVAPPPGSVPTCDTAGILGPVVSVIAGLQCTEALKYLSGNVDDMSRHLVSIDAWTQVMTRLSVPRSGGRRRCDACDGLQFDYLAGRGSRSVTLCGRNAVQVAPEARAEVSLQDLASRLPSELGARATPFLLRFSVRHNQEELSVSVFTDGRAIVTGTVDPAVARSVVARYVGV